MNGSGQRRLTGQTLFWLAVYGLAGAAALLTGMALLAPWGWFFELAVHFRLQYGVVALLAVPAFLAGRRWPAAVLSLLVALANLSLLWPYYAPRPPAAPQEQSLRAMALNVHWLNRSYEKVGALVEAFQPDFLALSEVDAAWVAYLARLRPEAAWSRPVFLPQYGLALFSRFPFQQLPPYAAGTRPAIAIAPDAGNRPFVVLAIHGYAPFYPARYRMRNEQLRQLAPFVASRPERVLVLGDFNTTPWSPPFRELLRQAGLEECRQGFGLNSTWHALLLPLRIPIDHCLASPSIAIHDFRSGPFVKSDHLPILVTFSLARR